jgi:hypothetical protein
MIGVVVGVSRSLFDGSLRISTHFCLCPSVFLLFDDCDVTSRKIVIIPPHFKASVSVCVIERTHPDNRFGSDRNKTIREIQTKINCISILHLTELFQTSLLYREYLTTDLSI